MRNILIEFYLVTYFFLLSFDKNPNVFKGVLTCTVISLLLTALYAKFILYIRDLKIARDRRIAAYETIYNDIDKINFKTSHEDFIYTLERLENFLNEYNDNKLFHILHSKLLINYRGEII